MYDYYAWLFSNNQVFWKFLFKASLNLLEKVGFIKDGVLRKRRIDKNTGEYRDLVVYSITTNDK